LDRRDISQAVRDKMHELFENKVEGEFDSLKVFASDEDKISRGTAFIMAANHVLQKIHLFEEVTYSLILLSYLPDSNLFCNFLYICAVEVNHVYVLNPRI